VSDEEAFHRLLDADPDNFDARAIFADWLEEQGSWKAAGYRWMWRNERRASPTKMYRKWGWYYWGHDPEPDLWREEGSGVESASRQ